MIDTTSLRHGCLVYFRSVFDEVTGREVTGRSREGTRGHARSREVTGGHRRFRKARNKLRIQETVILQLCLITSKSLTSKSLTSKSLTSKSLTTLSHYK